MAKRYHSLLLPLLFTALALNPLNSSAQLTVSNAGNYRNINYLVRNILLGNGVVVSNITYSGSDTAVGFFNGMSSNLGLDSGLVLTNGTITDCPGPDQYANFINYSYSWPNCSSYSAPDLVQLSGGIVNDAAIINFDFIPYSDTIKFQYVWGSYEYPDFVNSYNDVFGFFVSGPGISGPFLNSAEDIAILPDNMNTPVSIDSVNCNVHSNYYICNYYNSNPCLANCPTQAQEPFTTVGYNGFTVPLWAVAAVQCGKTYHIKIAVADAIDCNYDSGVFLRSGSFKSNGSSVSDAISYNHQQSPNDSVLYRGSCGSASIFFHRSDSSSTDTILIDTSGTATPGIDYSPIKDTMIIPIGKGSDTLNINALLNPYPGFRTLILKIRQRICGNLDTTTIKIYIGNPKVVIAQPPVYVCPAGNVTITPVVSGGVSNKYRYYWNPVDTNNTITLSNLSNDTILVFKAKDICGDSALDSVKITVAAKIKLTTRDTAVNCPASPLSIGVLVSGGVPVYTYSWSNGATTSSITVNPVNSATYTIGVQDSCGSMAKDSVRVTVNDIPLKAVANDTTINCPANATLNVWASGGGGGYTYNWSNGATSSSISVSPLRDTSYIVTVQSPCGNQQVTDTIKVKVNIAPLAVTARDTTISCSGTASLNAFVSGGGNGYSYRWSNGATTSSISVSPQKDTSYIVSVSTPCGNQHVTDTVKVTVTPPGFNLNTTPDTHINCPNDTVTLWAAASPAGGCYKYAWSNGATVSSVMVNPAATNSFSVTVSDTCCGIFNKSNTITITVPTITPLSVTVYPDSINVCPGDEVNLLAAANGGNGVFSYRWTPLVLPADTVTYPDSSHALIRGFISGTYEVVVNDQCGNSDSGKVIVGIIPGCDIRIPNVITPNGDPSNQYFFIKNLEYYPGSMLIIYARGGKEIFQSSDYQNNWDGRNEAGDKVSDGVYYYILHVSNGKKYTGFIQVLN